MKISLLLLAAPLFLPINAAHAKPQRQIMANEKAALARRVAKIDARTAEVIRSASSEITVLPTPFLRTGKIYRVAKFLPTRPLILFIGADDQNFTIVLNANPQGYFALAKNAGLLLQKPEERLDYVTTYLTTVESPNQRLQILHSVKELKSRPNLNATEKIAFAKFQSQYEKTIMAPIINNTIPYQAIIFAIKNQDLLRLNVTLSADGKITFTETVIEKNLLIPYAM